MLSVQPAVNSLTIGSQPLDANKAPIVEIAELSPPADESHALQGNNSPVLGASGWAWIHATGEVGNSDPDRGIPFEDVGGQSGSGGNIDWSLGLGVLVRSITVWWKYDDLGIHGIRFSFWNGKDTDVRGQSQGNKSILNLAQNETITKCSLWGNGPGTNCGRIRLQTSLGQDFNVGKDVSGQDEYQMSVWSGIMIGGYGKSGVNVDYLGFYFIGEVQSCKIANTVFETKNLSDFYRTVS